MYYRTSRICLWHTMSLCLLCVLSPLPLCRCLSMPLISRVPLRMRERF